MDTDKKTELYHNPTYHASGKPLMSYEPINRIHQHLCAFHTYSEDPTRQVEAHHFCTHLNPDMHQCIIYDSDQPGARLIGIEYLVTEKIFKSLPAEEKVYWHSHKYEVGSGILQLQVKSMVPNAAIDTVEQPAMLNLYTVYGKTIHTWEFDKHPDVPIGPPHLMMSYTEPSQVDWKKIEERDKRLGMDTEAKRKLREDYLPKDYVVQDGADWGTGKGKGAVFKREEVDTPGSK